MRLAICLILSFFNLFLFADEGEKDKEDTIIVIPSGVVHQGNYFAIGDSVEISGTVNGDVYVLAEQVIIDGVVNGDVLGIAGSMDISGKVINCRVCGGQVLISGEVGNNVTAISGNLQLLSSASIRNSLVAVAGNVDLAARIGSDATVMASNLRVSSEIKEDLQCSVGNMRITSKAIIGGNLDYRSNAPVWIDPSAIIRGITTHHPSFVHELVKGTWIQGFLVGSKILAILMNFIYTVAIGMILIKIFPQNLESAQNALRGHPFKCLSYGIILLILLPLVALVLLMTIIGVPFALTLIALNVITFYTAKIYCILFVSNGLFRKIGLRANSLPSLLLGLFVYFCLTAIPVFGPILAFVTMLFGLGAGTLAQTKRGFFKAQTPRAS